MKSLKKIKLTNGVYWVEIPKANLRLLCGCPADSVKHLKKSGLIRDEEKNGVKFQTGPNAILLSEGLIQNSQFANLAEFPVMQMLYFQRMIFPNHPNNMDAKPLLLGLEKQIEAQKEYIYRGNYGLDSLEELQAAGLSEAEAKTQMRLKLKFAFGKIRSSEELIDTLIVGEKPVEIKNGVLIQRISFNQYEITYGKEVVSIDLNLAPGELYLPSYSLEYHQIDRNYFSVIHSGEGDGWNPDNPCMGSIVIFQGKIYLIDVGPHISSTLYALGIGFNEIEGIFHTHAHDDHFTGLPALLASDHRIKYYATPPVRASVTKKLCALMSMSEDKFTQYFEIHDLEYDQWNNINGLEVKPLYSPHPVETSIFIFRTLWQNDYYTYAHLADIVALDVLQGMVTEDDSQPGLSQKFYEKIKSDYLTPVDLKKVDAGGGMIHGDAQDFAQDSSKMIYSHLTGTPTNENPLFKSIAHFGQVEVLIPAHCDYLREKARQYIYQFFPKVPPENNEVLWHCPIVSFEPGVDLLKADQLNPYVYLILTGTVAYQSKTRAPGLLSTGNLTGDIAVLKEVPSLADYRALCVIQALQIPAETYRQFIKDNALSEKTTKAQNEKVTLRSTIPFDDVNIDGAALEKISKVVSIEYCRKERSMRGVKENTKDLFILKDGEAKIYYQGTPLHTLLPGDYFGEEPFVYGSDNRFEVKATKPSLVYRVPVSVLQEIPIIHWRLLILSTKRMSEFQGSFPHLQDL